METTITRSIGNSLTWLRSTINRPSGRARLAAIESQWLRAGEALRSKNRTAALAELEIAEIGLGTLDMASPL